MGKDSNKRFVKDGPQMGIGGILIVVLAIAVVGGLFYFVATNYGDALFIPSKDEIKEIHKQNG